MSSTKQVFAVLCVALALPLASVRAQTVPEAAEPRTAPKLADVAPEIVATVNGKPITRDQLAAITVSLRGRQELETLILHEAIRQEALRKGVTVAQKEVDAFVRQRAQEEMDRMAREAGFESMAALEASSPQPRPQLALIRSELEKSLSALAGPELLGRKLVRMEAQVTDAEVKDEFERLHGPKAKVLQMTLGSREEAQDAIRRLELGADFVELARKMSRDRAALRNAGDARLVPRRDPLGEAAFNLGAGATSGAILMGKDFAVIKVMELLPADGKRLEDVQDAVREGILDAKVEAGHQKWIEDLMNRTRVERALEPREK